MIQKSIYISIAAILFFFLLVMLIYINRSWAAEKEVLREATTVLKELIDKDDTDTAGYYCFALAKSRRYGLITIIRGQESIVESGREFRGIDDILISLGWLPSVTLEQPLSTERKEFIRVLWYPITLYVILFFLLFLSSLGGIVISTVIILTRKNEEKKRRAEQQDNNEKQYSLLLETMQEGFLILDRDRNITYVNRQLSQIIGRSQEEIIGRPLLDFFDEKEHRSVKAHLARQTAGDLSSYELKWRASSGEEIPSKISPQQLFNEEGDINKTFFVVTDLRENRKAAQALIESEERYRLLFENMLDGVGFHQAVYDDEGKPIDYIFLDANKRFELYTGLHKEDIIGRRVSDLIPGIRDAKPDLITLYGEVAQTGGRNQFELYFEPFDRWYSVVAFSPKKGYFFAVFEDLTGLKQTLREKVSLLEKLSARNEELKNLIYISSHDLRSPLVNIEGFCSELTYNLDRLKYWFYQSDEKDEKVLADIMDHEIPEAMGYISESVAKMDRLLKGLLKMSRLGNETLNIKKLDLNKLVQDLLNAELIAIDKKYIQIEVNELPDCYGDEAQLMKVFTKLLENSIEFMDIQKPGQIRISGYKENQQCVYCVEDNGIGIPDKFHEKVFQIFGRLNPSPGDEKEGLGLAMVKKIITRLNGKVWLESEEGKGSKFYFSLPNIEYEHQLY